jgi:hypothetical protein
MWRRPRCDAYFFAGVAICGLLVPPKLEPLGSEPPKSEPISEPPLLIGFGCGFAAFFDGTVVKNFRSLSRPAPSSDGTFFDGSGASV